MPMTSRADSGLLCARAFIFLWLAAFCNFAAFAQSNTVAGPDATAAGNLRAALEIQEQIHNTQLTIEKYRLEAEAIAASNSEAIQARFANLDKSLDARRLEELREIERSDFATLIAVGVFAVVGFIVLLIAAWLQWNAVNRLATAAARLPSGPVLQAITAGEGQLLPAQVLEQSTARFLGAIEKLEQRIQNMETASPPKSLPETAPPDGDAAVSNSILPAPPSPPAEKDNSIALMLAKAQTLLRLDKAQDALDCVDEILALDPANTEAFLRKGAALERLERLPEAIACYDRAIAEDRSITLAYLYKGAVFNRMERYTEALECYEQALKTRQKGHAANVIFE